jgi:hypothetical protein
MPGTMADLVTAVTNDATAVANDATAITNAQNAVAAAQAQQSTDQAQQVSDQSTLASALAQTGPIEIPDPSGNFVTVYSTSTSPPGYQTQQVPSGASVPIPTPSPTPAPPSS